MSLLIKNKSAINIIETGLKIDSCEIPKSIFRKLLNSEPSFVFFIEIGRNNGEQSFIKTNSI